MNVSSRVPGVSRNSGWQAIDAGIEARRADQQKICNNGNASPAQPALVDSSGAKPSPSP
jgi:hypothetical protein